MSSRPGRQFSGFLRVRTAMVYHLTKYDLKIMCTDLDHHPKVVVTLGSEERRFHLKGFIGFWLDVIRSQRRAVDRYFELIASATSKGSKRRATTRGVKRQGLEIKFVHLNHVKPELVVALGSEVRTLQLEEFIEFEEEMKKLLPRAAAARTRYVDKRDQQRELVSVETRPSRESVREGNDSRELAVPDRMAGIFKPATTGPVWSKCLDVGAEYTETGVIVFSVSTDIWCRLRGIASQIWLAMQLSPWGITLAGIVGILEEDVMIPREVLASEVAEFLDNLERMGLVRCEGGSASERVGARDQ